MNNAKKKLGQLLIEAGLIDEVQLKSALASQREWGGRLGSIIIRKGFVSEQDMLSVMEIQLGISCIYLDEIERPPEEVFKLVSADIAKKYQIFPLGFEGKTLSIAISDPTDLETLDDISFMLGVSIKPLLSIESEIMKAIEIHYEGKSSVEPFKRDREKTAREKIRTMPFEFEIENIKTTPAEEIPKSEDTSTKNEFSEIIVIKSIIDLLIEKDIFTTEELINRIKSKKQS